MKRHIHQILVRLFLVSLILSALAANLAATAYQDERTRDAQAIVNEHNRRNFGEAARLLNHYIRKWIPDRGSISFLKGVYRLGVYYELTGHNENAQICYEAALTHPRLDAPQAVFNNLRIRAVVRQRLEKVRARLGGGISRTIQNGVPDVPNAGNGNVIELVRIGSGKNPIRTEARIAGEKLKPYTNEEKMALLARQLPPVKIHEAAKQAENILQSIAVNLTCNGRPVPKPAINTKIDENLIVFGINGQEEDVLRLIDHLKFTRQNLKQKYFTEAAARSPQILYVYANFTPVDSFCDEDEHVGQRLSEVLHFRPMSGFEGYYQALDNSLVLRKGLRARSGDLFFGTATHEFVHALMRDEYPDLPLWLDEGVAALHEEQDRQGPVDNYRLYYLLEAIKVRQMPSLKELLNGQSPGWFNNKQLIMAAAARYFCFYLAQAKTDQNILAKVYREMRDSSAKGAAAPLPEIFAPPSSGSPALEETFLSYAELPDDNARQSVHDALDVLKKATGMSEKELEKDFLDFIQTRPVARVDLKWGSLKNDISLYVKTWDVTQTANTPVIERESSLPPVNQDLLSARSDRERTLPPDNPTAQIAPRVATADSSAAVRSQSIRIENSSTLLGTKNGDDWWAWTVFVTAPDETLNQIKCVRYTLHPTFPEPVTKVCKKGSDRQAFALSSEGWGTFRINIRVYFRNGKYQDFTHDLKFTK
jgi:hypothetical protein